MPFYNNRKFTTPVKAIEISSFDFDTKKVTTPISCPKGLLYKISRPLLKQVPEAAEIKEYKNTIIVNFGTKRMTISAWMFDTEGCQTRPFKALLKEGFSVSVVLAVHFFENGKFVSGLHKASDSKVAIGLIKSLLTVNKNDFMQKIIDQTRQQYGAEAETSDTKINYYADRYASGLANALATTVLDFFDPDDDIMNATIEALNNYDSSFAIVKQTAHTFNGKLQLKDYLIDIQFTRNQDDGSCKLVYVIPHKYTETDLVYGAQYFNTDRTVVLNSVDDVNKMDIDAIMKYLYDNRAGKCWKAGSLGT